MITILVGKNSKSREYYGVPVVESDAGDPLPISRGVFSQSVDEFQNGVKQLIADGDDGEWSITIPQGKNSLSRKDRNQLLDHISS